MPGEVAVDDHAAVGHRAVEVGEPVEQHGRRDAGQGTMVDRDATPAMRMVAAMDRRRVDGPQRVEHRTSHEYLQDTAAFLMSSG